MRVLAFDTATKSLSAAVIDDGCVLFSHTGTGGGAHSETLMPLILRALRETGLGFSDVHLVACTAGPGSYTGIRIGIATAKAVAYASGRPAAGVSTLETLAFPHRAAGTLVCPMIDARNRRVFAAVYTQGGCAAEEGNYAAAELPPKIAEAVRAAAEGGAEAEPVRRIVFCGDAAEAYGADPEFREALSGIRSGGEAVACLFLNTAPEAADVGRIAAGRASAAGTMPDPFDLQARYISPSQAERMKERRRGPGAAVPAATVREAREEDAPVIRRLEEECFAMPWSEESLRRDIRENDFAMYFVAEAEGAAAGYIGVYFSCEDAQVTNLAVTPGLRGRGIGRMLVRRALDFCADAGCERVTLEVREGNSGAIALYFSEGFRDVGIRKGYYENNGENAIIMLKNLVKP